MPLPLIYMCYKTNLQIIYFFAFLLLLQSCGSAEQATVNNKKKYSLYIRVKDGSEYMVETDSLTGGDINAEKEGAPLNIKEVSREMIVKDNFYYYPNFKNSQFIKYAVTNVAFKKIDSVTLKDFSVENFYWLGKDTLLLTGLMAPNFGDTRYFTVNTAAMRVIASGKMDIPSPKGSYKSMSIGFVEPRDSSLVVGYTYHKPVGTTSYTTSDTTYVTTLSYPGMKALQTVTDIRSTYPAGVNTVQSYTFDDEQGNFYYMTCPGIALGNRPDVPTGIFRINKGSNGPDKNYFFNLSASVVNNHAYGLWYLGNGKAIVRSERKDLYKDLNDHYSTPHFEFYLLDLAAQTAKKLNLPLDKGTRRECVIVEKDVAYISINSDKEGDFIWIYNINTGTLKKGLQLTGHTDYILRMDKLQAP